jgi:prefoldin subunit 5
MSSDEGVPMPIDDEPTNAARGPTTWREWVGQQIAVFDDRIKAIHHRLNEGSKTIATMQHGLDETRKPISKVAVASIVIALLVPVGGSLGMLIWNAARYPERSEFEAVRADLTGRINTNASMVHDSQRDIIDLRKSIDRVEASQEQTNKKLDELLVRVAKP